jgi:TorA maturation chaperone TorD
MSKATTTDRDPTQARELALCRSALSGALSLAFHHPTAEILAALSSEKTRVGIFQAASLLDEQGGNSEPIATDSLPEDRPLNLVSKAESWLSSLSSLSLDELLSAHGRLFGHTARGLVCSYETEYGQEGLFQQPAQLANLTGIYGLFGLKVRQVERERPDHISCELEFLEFLLKKQAYALEHGDESMEKETRKATRLFLKEHLGRFGRAFGAQMKKHDREGFMGKAGDLTLEFLTVECRRLDLEPGLMQLPLRSTAEDQVPMACGGGESDLVQLGS